MGLTNIYDDLKEKLSKKKTYEQAYGTIKEKTEPVATSFKRTTRKLGKTVTTKAKRDYKEWQRERQAMKRYEKKQQLAYKKHVIKQKYKKKMREDTTSQHSNPWQITLKSSKEKNI